MNHLLTRLKTIGNDGLLMFLLSNVVMILGAGLTMGLSLWRVSSVARSSGAAAPQGCTLVVLGMRLENNNIAADYKARLDRVVSLCKVTGQHGAVHDILVVGGRTGGGEISEAEGGRTYLVSQGIPPARIHIEDESVHTLENLRNVRALLNAQGSTGITLITNRYHLARSKVIADGLGLQLTLCGAEEHFRIAARQIPRLLLESYYIHWYYTGAAWSRITRNRKSLERIC